MSQAPSTLGIIITLSLSPISPTSCVMSSSTHGDSRLLTRVHSCVSPSSISLPTLISPARAPSLRSTGTASSRLPSRMSTVGAMSGTFATIFSLEKSRKWIIREGRTGISRAGSGASIASGLKKSRGLRIRPWSLGDGALDLGDRGAQVLLDVVPREAQREPAGEDRLAVALLVTPLRRARPVGVEAVELDEDFVAGPHEVGLQGQVIEDEGLVDERLRQPSPPQFAEQLPLQEAAGRVGLRAVRREEL